MPRRWPGIDPSTQGDQRSRTAVPLAMTIPSDAWPPEFGIGTPRTRPRSGAGLPASDIRGRERNTPGRHAAGRTCMASPPSPDATEFTRPGSIGPPGDCRTLQLPARDSTIQRITTCHIHGDRECGTRKSPRLTHFLPRLGTKCPSHGRTGLDRRARESGERSGNPCFPSRRQYLTMIVNGPRRCKRRAPAAFPDYQAGRLLRYPFGGLLDVH